MRFAPSVPNANFGLFPFKVMSIEFYGPKGDMSRLMKYSIILRHLEKVAPDFMQSIK